VIAAAVLLLATGGGAVDCGRLLQSSTVPVENSPSSNRNQEARGRLEAARVAFCAPSRSEELIYLNHLTLGFTGWIAARARRPPGEYDLASIIRRARTHRARGRSRLQ
jgi:hypothetical protein